jgi:hypothetical protein
VAGGTAGAPLGRALAHQRGERVSLGTPLLSRGKGRRKHSRLESAAAGAMAAAGVHHRISQLIVDVISRCHCAVLLDDILMVVFKKCFAHAIMTIGGKVLTNIKILQTFRIFTIVAADMITNSSLYHFIKTFATTIQITQQPTHHSFTIQWILKMAQCHWKT